MKNCECPAKRHSNLAQPAGKIKAELFTLHFLRLSRCTLYASIPQGRQAFGKGNSAPSVLPAIHLTRHFIQPHPSNSFNAQKAFAPSPHRASEFGIADSFPSPNTDKKPPYSSLFLRAAHSPSVWQQGQTFIAAHCDDRCSTLRCLTENTGMGWRVRKGMAQRSRNKKTRLNGQVWDAACARAGYYFSPARSRTM